MFESVKTLLAEHEDLQGQLSDPALHSDPVRSKRVNRRYAELSRIVAAYHEWRQLVRRPGRRAARWPTRTSRSRRRSRASRRTSDIVAGAPAPAADPARPG